MQQTITYKIDLIYDLDDNYEKNLESICRRHQELQTKSIFRDCTTNLVHILSSVLAALAIYFNNIPVKFIPEYNHNGIVRSITFSDHSFDFNRLHFYFYMQLYFNILFQTIIFKNNSTESLTIDY